MWENVYDRSSTVSYSNVSKTSCRVPSLGSIQTGLKSQCLCVAVFHFSSIAFKEDVVLFFTSGSRFLSEHREKKVFAFGHLEMLAPQAPISSQFVSTELN